MAPKETTAQPHGAPVATASASAVNVYAYRHFIGGAVGGMTAAVITSPLEVVKTRLQIKGGQYVAAQCNALMWQQRAAYSPGCA